MTCIYYSTSGMVHHTEKKASMQAGRLDDWLNVLSRKDSFRKKVNWMGKKGH